MVNLPTLKAPETSVLSTAQQTKSVRTIEHGLLVDSRKPASDPAAQPFARTFHVLLDDMKAQQTNRADVQATLRQSTLDDQAWEQAESAAAIKPADGPTLKLSRQPEAGNIANVVLRATERAVTSQTATADRDTIWASKAAGAPSTAVHTLSTLTKAVPLNSVDAPFSSRSSRESTKPGKKDIEETPVLLLQGKPETIGPQPHFYPAQEFRSEKGANWLTRMGVALDVTEGANLTQAIRPILSTSQVLPRSIVTVDPSWSHRLTTIADAWSRAKPAGNLTGQFPVRDRADFAAEYGVSASDRDVSASAALAAVASTNADLPQTDPMGRLHSIRTSNETEQTASATLEETISKDGKTADDSLPVSSAGPASSEVSLRSTLPSTRGLTPRAATVTDMVVAENGSGQENSAEAEWMLPAVSPRSSSVGPASLKTVSVARPGNRGSAAKLQALVPSLQAVSSTRYASLSLNEGAGSTMHEEAGPSKASLQSAVLQPSSVPSHTSLLTSLSTSMPASPANAAPRSQAFAPMKWDQRLPGGTTADDAAGLGFGALQRVAGDPFLPQASSSLPIGPAHESAHQQTDPFVLMDQVAATTSPLRSGTTHILHAMLPEAEQGVAGLRAQSSAGRVSASLEATTAASINGLAAQIPSIHQFLSEHGVDLHRLQVEEPDSGRGDQGSQTAMQQDASGHSRNAHSPDPRTPDKPSAYPLLQPAAEAGREEVMAGSISIRA